MLPGGVALRPDVPVERHGIDPEFTAERGHGSVAVRHRRPGPAASGFSTTRTSRRRSVREAARQHHVKTASSGPEVTTVKHWLRWSARHKWVSRSLARDEWIARTSDEQIVSNVTACKLALTTRAHGFLTANDGPNFLRAARALSLHVPPMQRVADVSERIDLSDVPDAPREERRAIRDAARQKNEETPVTHWRDHSPECCGVAVVLRCGTRSPDSGNSSRSEARLMP